jgi:hypothetical protein
LHIYSELEDILYSECQNEPIKKNASISRFESALFKQGYNTSDDNWQSLLNISKIRNFLLHGNGRLDFDKYGIDTRAVINILNSHANKVLVEVINLKGTSSISIREEFLNYCLVKIQQALNKS